jgi:hypothetical protein
VVTGWHDGRLEQLFDKKGMLIMAGKTRGIIFLVLVLVCLAGCSDEDTVDKPPSPARPARAEAVEVLHIVFKWPGDDFASLQDLEIRDKIARTIEEKGIGTVTRVGTGMGTMEIVVKVEQQETARSAIEAIIREIAPDTKSTIR